MKKPITAISITRRMAASKFGLDRDTRVTFHRGGESVSGFSTHPLARGKYGISFASVLRSKRAQLVLLERALVHDLRNNA